MRRFTENHRTDGCPILVAFFATGWGIFFVLLFSVVIFAVTAHASSPDGKWLDKVPPRDREKANPYQSQPDAISAGRRIYEDHCMKCHGENAEGNKKHPSLLSDRVQTQATEGDLHWLLVNGYMRKGMPSWSKLPDPQLWQLITYIKSLK